MQCRTKKIWNETEFVQYNIVTNYNASKIYYMGE